MKVPEAFNTIKESTKEENKMAAKDEAKEIATQPDICDSDISKACPAPKSNEELEDDTPETPVETLEQSKEDE